MKTYKFSFHGRQAGAIGITYDIKETYKAQNLSEARSLLYEDYELIRPTTIKIKENTKEIYLEKFNNCRWIEVRSNRTRKREEKTGSYLSSDLFY